MLILFGWVKNWNKAIVEMILAPDWLPSPICCTYMSYDERDKGLCILASNNLKRSPPLS